MAKHYEALQRAEAERRRKVVGEPAPVAPTEWDTTPASAPKHKKGLLDKMLSRRQVAESGMETASDLNKRRIAMLQPESFASEQFRTLRGRIDSLATQQAIKTVSIASANSGEGKTMASINLAVVTSMSVGRKVLLVDCDLRQPKIHISLGLEPAIGLSEVLSGKASLEDAVMFDDPVDSFAHVGLEDGGADLWMIIRCEGVTDIVKQGGDDVFLVASVAHRQRCGLQAMC